MGTQSSAFPQVAVIGASKRLQDGLVVVVACQVPADEILAVGQIGLARRDQVLELEVAATVANDAGSDSARCLRDGRELFGSEAGDDLDEVAACLDLAPYGGASR